MNELELIKQKEKLVYKKCCNYACECNSDELRKILGDTANKIRLRLGGDCEELKND